jgi:hypothetical protein
MGHVQTTVNNASGSLVDSFAVHHRSVTELIAGFGLPSGEGWQASVYRV